MHAIVHSYKRMQSARNIMEYGSSQNAVKECKQKSIKNLFKQNEIFLVLLFVRLNDKSYRKQASSASQNYLYM